MKKLFIIALGFSFGAGLVLAWRKQSVEEDDYTGPYYPFPCDAESRAARSRSRISALLTPFEWD